eukprot:TRINITY_DN97173_c0_g1_i1.p1 TRINITY_DN97173_c0_g1~~TRINITY_DN97173_c0_g1_i1.p1  ORF type:complete len:181 (-),score=39.26 TRINITY_DN97173_c0_g1_i1:359-901(-)
MSSSRFVHLARRYVEVSNRVGKAAGEQAKRELLESELFPMYNLDALSMFGLTGGDAIKAAVSKFFLESYPTVFFRVEPEYTYEPVPAKAIEKVGSTLREEWQACWKEVGLDHAAGIDPSAALEPLLETNAGSFCFRRFYDDAEGQRVSLMGEEFLLFDEEEKIIMIAYMQKPSPVVVGAE